jgi:hypothetical protein
VFTSCISFGNTHSGSFLFCLQRKTFHNLFVKIIILSFHPGRSSRSLKMFTLIACLVVALLGYFLYNFAYRDKIAAFATFPTLERFFLLHNTLSLLSITPESLFDTLENWQRMLGEVFLITINPFHCGFVLVNDPVVAEAVSLHQPDRSRSFLYLPLAEWIGDGFFLSRSEKSKKLMKPLWLAFNPKNHDRVRTNIKNFAHNIIGLAKDDKMLTIYSMRHSLTSIKITMLKPYPRSSMKFQAYLSWPESLCWISLLVRNF